MRASLTQGAKIEQVLPGTWRLSIPGGPQGTYRLAQLDNYRELKRRSFPYKEKFRMSLEARASQPSLPGTWGFGLWNDPFGMGILAGRGLRLPDLPNTAWFFYASAQSYLSLHDDLPANGLLCAAFLSPHVPPVLLALAAAGLPLMLIPAAARLLLRLARRVVSQAGTALHVDPCAWHEYSLDWSPDRARFRLDGENVLQTQVSPRGPLGLVIWIDNQFAALPPGGRVRYGMQANLESAWIEIRDLHIEPAEA
jgi:hypothetical protein